MWHTETKVKGPGSQKTEVFVEWERSNQTIPILLNKCYDMAMHKNQEGELKCGKGELLNPRRVSVFVFQGHGSKKCAPQRVTASPRKTIKPSCISNSRWGSRPRGPELHLHLHLLKQEGFSRPNLVSSAQGQTWVGSAFRAEAKMLMKLFLCI